MPYSDRCHSEVAQRKMCEILRVGNTEMASSVSSRVWVKTSKVKITSKEINTHERSTRMGDQHAWEINTHERSTRMRDQHAWEINTHERSTRMPLGDQHA
jgi:hypothetical protein